MVFTPVNAIVGGAMIGLAAFWNAGLNGLVTGISGTLNSCLTLDQFALSFVAGLVSSSFILQPLVDVFPPEDVLLSVPPAFLVLSGVLVGAGTRIGNGCTSGHGICGLARLSKRSLVAVLAFMIVAMTVASLNPFVSFPVQPAPPPLSASRLVVLATLALSIPPLLAMLEAQVALRFSLGVIFAGGLIISGMWHPTKTLSFLRIPLPFQKVSTWDPSLLFVFVGALPVAFAGFQPILNGIKPLLAEKHSFPTRSDIDKRLLLGSSLFGIGWGLIGMCPGPALVYGGRFPAVPALTYLLSLVGGSFITANVLKALSI